MGQLAGLCEDVKANVPMWSDYADRRETGDGFPRDLEQAVRYFKTAADQGHVRVHPARVHKSEELVSLDGMLAHLTRVHEKGVVVITASSTNYGDPYQPKNVTDHSSIVRRLML